MSTLKYFSCIFLLSFQSISAQNFWQQINGPFGEVDELFLTQSNYILAVTHLDGIHWSSNNGESWTKINPPSGISIKGTINDSIFVGGGSQQVFISNDTGKTWSPTGNMTVKSMYFEPISQVIYVGTFYGYGGICAIYKSFDFGQNWTLLYQFPIQSLAQGITSLYVTKTNNVILASEYLGSPQGVYHRFHQSTDQGQTWQIIYQNTIIPVTSITEDIYYNLYALAYNQLLVSTNEGQTWITKNIPGSRVLASDHSGRVFFDLRYSTDQGSTWFAMPGSGFEGAFNDALAINQNNRIYAASTSGIFYGEADSLVVSVENIKPVKSFFLSQNYPNPFNPSTKIQYEIPEHVRNDSRLVTLKVYDVLGNEIATLVNEVKQPGSYEVEFSGKLLTSGIYFYRLKAGNFVKTKKMILLK